MRHHFPTGQTPSWAADLPIQIESESVFVLCVFATAMGFYPDNFPEVSFDVIIPDRLFFYAGVVIAVIIFLKEYIELFVSSCQKSPKSLFCSFVVAAWTFTYIMIVMAVAIEDHTADHPAIQLVRCGLVLGLSYYFSF